MVVEGCSERLLLTDIIKEELDSNLMVLLFE